MLPTQNGIQASLFQYSWVPLVIKHCSHVKKIILTVCHQIFCQANLSDNNEVQYGLTDCQIKE